LIPWAQTDYEKTNILFLTWKDVKSPDLVPANKNSSFGFEKAKQV
jgi:hypothetical protein